MVLRMRSPSRIAALARSTLVSADSKTHQFPVGKGTTLGTLKPKDRMGPGGSVMVSTMSGKGPPPPMSLNSVCMVTVTC
jgi:hypothetical protein